MNRLTLLFTLSIPLIFMASSESIGQLFPTNLRVTVIDGLGNFVEGAVVTVYATEKDYENSVNPIQQEITDKKGKVKLKRLDEKAYYVDVRKAEMNNDGEGVKTGKLSKGRLNKINVVIE